MYKYQLEDVLSGKNITRIIDSFKKNELDRFQLLERYYRVENKIKSRTMDHGKPNNRLAHGTALRRIIFPTIYLA